MASIIDAIIRLRDQFTPTLSRVRTQLSETQRVSQRAARDVSRLGESISGIGEKMMIPTAAIGATVVKAADTYMGFEKTMTQAKIRSQSTKEEFEQMMEAAIDYAGTYPASGEEVARVFDMLAAAGFKAGQQIGTVPAILEGAIAAGGDIEGMADVIVKTMSSFHLKGENVEETKRNAGMIADIMQTTVNNSRMNMADLGVTMGYLGAPAAAAGASLSELGAAMAIASNAGLDASTVGTSLRAIFLRLAAEPKATAKALKELGVSAGDSVGDFKSLMSVMDELRPKIKDLGSKEQMEIAKSIAGMEASSAFLALINTSEEKFHELQKAIENSGGASKAAFEEMNNSMWGAMKSMESATEELFNILGQALKPVIVDVMNGIRDFALSVKNFAKENPETVQLVIKLAGGFVALTAGMLVAGKAISLFGSFAGFLAPIGTQLANGTTLMGLFSGRIASLGTSFQTVRNVGILATNQLLSPFRSMGNILTGPFQAFGRAAAQMHTQLRSFGTPISVLRAGFYSLRESFMLSSVVSRITAFRGAVSSNFGSIINIIKGIPGAIMNLPQTFSSIVAAGRRMLSLRNIFTALVNGFRVISLAFASNPVGLALLAIGVAAIFVARNWETFKQVAETVWQKISYVLSEVITNIKNRFSGLVEHGQQVFNRLVEAWNTLTGSSASSGETISLVINTLGSVFTAGFDIIVTVVEYAINNIFTVLNGLLTVLDGVIQFIVGVFTGNWSAAWEGIKTIFTGIFDTITGIFDNFINAISSGIDRILGKADTASEKAAQAEAASKGEGHNALGTSFWKGGLTWVHEQGPEIIDLPNGTRVIPHSSSLKEEFNRGFSQGTNLISQAAAEMPEQTRAFIAGGAAGVPIENSVGGSSDITPMKEPERDGLGNISGVDVPEYNIITPEDSISVRRSKMAAQEKQLREQDASGEVVAPGIPADGGGNVERDALGNIQGANIPEYNIIRPEDSISVRRSKQIAQERQVFAATAEETGNATSDTRAAESTGRPESNLQEGISTGRPSSNVQEAEPTGTPSSDVKERTEPPKASPNITVQIPKLADQIVIREKADADYLINQLIYRFQAHAMNRVVHAVR